MRKSLTILLVITLLVSALFVFTGCDEKKEESVKDISEKGSAVTTPDNGNTNDIVGEWKNTTYGMEFVYTFNVDGTGKYDAAGTLMPFTYKIDGDKISILYEGDTLSFDTTFSINGNTLNVLDSRGEDTLYEKVK